MELIEAVNRLTASFVVKEGDPTEAKAYKQEMTEACEMLSHDLRSLEEVLDDAEFAPPHPGAFLGYFLQKANVRMACATAKITGYEALSLQTLLKDRNTVTPLFAKQIDNVLSGMGCDTPFPLDAILDLQEKGEVFQAVLERRGASLNYGLH